MIKGVLFDKDGTLIRFMPLWKNAAEYAIKQLFEAFTIAENPKKIDLCLQAIGVYKDRIDPKGALAYKTYSEMAEDLHPVLLQFGEEIDLSLLVRCLEHSFETFLLDHPDQCVPVCDLTSLFKQLHQKKIRIGLATADNQQVTKRCLHVLGIEKSFDYIGCDDGQCQPKPASDMFETFQEKFSLQSEEIAVVGDSLNDMRFAKDNGGLAVGVLSGVGLREELISQADFVLESIKDVPSLIEQEVKDSGRN